MKIISDILDLLDSNPMNVEALMVYTPMAENSDMQVLKWQFKIQNLMCRNLDGVHG